MNSTEAGQPNSQEQEREILPDYYEIFGIDINSLNDENYIVEVLNKLNKNEKEMNEALLSLEEEESRDYAIEHLGMISDTREILLNKDKREEYDERLQNQKGLKEIAKEEAVPALDGVVESAAVESSKKNPLKLNKAKTETKLDMNDTSNTEEIDMAPEMGLEKEIKLAELRVDIKKTLKGEGFLQNPEESQESLLGLIGRSEIADDQKEKLIKYVDEYVKAQIRVNDFLRDHISENNEAEIAKKLFGKEISDSKDGSIKVEKGPGTVVLKVSNDVFKQISGESTNQEVKIDDKVFALHINCDVGDKSIGVVLINMEHEAITEGRFKVEDSIDHEQFHEDWQVMEAVNPKMKPGELSTKERESLQKEIKKEKSEQKLNEYIQAEIKYALYRTQDEILGSCYNRDRRLISSKFKEGGHYDYLSELRNFADKGKSKEYREKINEAINDYYNTVENAVVSFGYLVDSGKYDKETAVTLLTNNHFSSNNEFSLKEWPQKVSELLKGEMAVKKGEDEERFNMDDLEKAIENKNKSDSNDEDYYPWVGGAREARDYLEREILLTEVCIDNLKKGDAVPVLEDEATSEQKKDAERLMLKNQKRKEKIAEYEIRLEILNQKWEKLKDVTAEHSDNVNERAGVINETGKFEGAKKRGIRENDEARKELIGETVSARKIEMDVREKEYDNLLKKIQEVENLCSGFNKEFEKEGVKVKIGEIRAEKYFDGKKTKYESLRERIKDKKGKFLKVEGVFIAVRNKIRDLEEAENYLNRKAEEVRDIIRSRKEELRNKEKEQEMMAKGEYDKANEKEFAVKAFKDLAKEAVNSKFPNNKIKQLRGDLINNTRELLERVGINDFDEEKIIRLLVDSRIDISKAKIERVKREDWMGRLGFKENMVNINGKYSSLDEFKDMVLRRARGRYRAVDKQELDNKIKENEIKSFTKDAIRKVEEIESAGIKIENKDFLSLLKDSNIDIRDIEVEDEGGVMGRVKKAFGREEKIIRMGGIEYTVQDFIDYLNKNKIGEDAIKNRTLKMLDSGWKKKKENDTKKAKAEEKREKSKKPRKRRAA